MMNNYYLSLARDKMAEALAAIEKADEYIALASRENSDDYSFRKSLKRAKTTLLNESERAASVMADKDLSSN